MIEAIAWAMIWTGFLTVCAIGIAWACVIPDEDRISGD